MLKIYLSLLFSLVASIIFSQDSLNMIRLARWDDDSLPIADPNNLRVQYSGCWGLAVNDHEYAVLGGARHVLIFDITSPNDPKLVGKFEGKSNTVWREFKSYKNRVYGVSDATTEGLMIFDFSNAPDTIVRTYYQNEFFNSAHTITLDTTSGRIYLNGTNVANQGLLVLDIKQNPDEPSLLASVPLVGGYIHDSYVRNDTVYASSGFNGYYVYDFTDPENPATIASLASTGGYHHNSWLSTDGQYAYCTEEIPSGRPVLIVDLKDLANANLEVNHSFLDPLIPPGTNSAIPHNVYIRDSLLFNSQYEDGLLVYNISDPTAPVLIAYYDTHPENTQYNTYYGCWGNYPWLPSGTIIAGDMQNGMQLLKINNITSTIAPIRVPVIQIFPNPASNFLTICRADNQAIKTLRMLNSTGQVVLVQPWPTSAAELRIPVGHLPKGLYLTEVRANNGAMAVKKVLIK
ncbi:MAG: choice-of-anchor B family protein [Lewinellaceae bacterium]|nr:choice-of-anchor B family protein [Lewinellaceae bacterium]